MTLEEALQELASTTNIKFARLLIITEYFFGAPRNRGTSHYAFKVPWQGEPRINLQRDKGGKAKPYQVKQVRAALLKLKECKQ
ncbi:toxin HicA [Tolypothrix sp. PCC 7910]|nr:toxin HicA [Tolypothrix sp. PCC 7910]